MSQDIEGDSGRRHVYALTLIAILAVAASLSGLGNGFTLDDVHIIVENHRVHALNELWRLFGQTYWPPEEGAALYRPLTMVAFSLQWVIGHGSPLAFHLTNLALYAFVAVGVYRLAILFVSPAAAFIGSALFAVHPVHTEAVANVVGQEELWVAALLLFGVRHFIQARRKRALSAWDVALLTAVYFAACMFKDHAIVFPALLLGADILVVERDSTMRSRIKSLWPLFVSLAVAGAIYVFLRTIVTGRFASGGSNIILLGLPFGTRVLTMLNIFMEWVRLLIWPATLSADYSTRRIHVATSFEASMLPGLVVLFSMAAIAWSVRRTKPAMTFGLLWAGVTLLLPSNIILVTGFVLAERTLFLPTVGLAICAGVLAVDVWRTVAVRGRLYRFATASFLFALLIAGIWRSSTRNPVWHDNMRLARQTVIDVPTSYRAHWMLAELLTDDGQMREGLDEMMLAVVLGRKNDPGLLEFAADRFRMANQCPRAMGMYRRALAIDPTLPELRFDASVCLLQLGKYEEAKSLAREGLRAVKNDAHLKRVLIVADSLKNLNNSPSSAG